MFFRASQVYGNETAVDDELVDVLLTPGLDDGAEEVFLKVLRAPAGPSPEELLPQIQVPVIGIWGVSKCSTEGVGGEGGLEGGLEHGGVGRGWEGSLARALLWVSGWGRFVRHVKRWATG